MASEQPEGGQSITSQLRGGAVPLLAALIGGAVVAIPTYLISNRQLDVKMLEIAVNILSQKPETNIQPARYWAVDVIKAYSNVPLSPEVQKALVENRALKLIFPDWVDYRGGGIDAAIGGGVDSYRPVGRGPNPGPAVEGLSKTK